MLNWGIVSCFGEEWGMRICFAVLIDGGVLAPSRWGSEEEKRINLAFLHCTK